jgi:hypothetical protein
MKEKAELVLGWLRKAQSDGVILHRLPDDIRKAAE